MPRAIPTAHMTPMRVSARWRVRRWTAPMPRAEAMLKATAPHTGLNPK
jgi:hypothetical protein